jgi:hypothetical protein
MIEVAEEDEDWNVVTDIVVGTEELDNEDSFEDVEGSVFVLDGETSCCGNEVVDEVLRRARLVPFEAVPKEDQYLPLIHVTLGTNIPSGSAFAAQHRIAAHNKDCRE